MSVPDLFLQGMARGWKTHNASQLEQDLQLDADIAIIGSGAGGATSAEILSQAGFKVLLIEEGPLKTSSDFKLLETEAYQSLYQEGIARMSKDGAITILQGRAVGGSTLVNWTSSFRTPEHTLQHWAEQHQVTNLSPAELAPWFAQMEQRLGIEPWSLPPNANNQVIQDGCQALGYHWSVIPRNVRGCWNLGYCGLGCPTNAKQSMLVSSIPSLLENSGELLYLARAERLLWSANKVTALECAAMDPLCVRPTGKRILVKAKHYILAGGGINSPAVLLRSQAPDPHERVGRRTYLHPVNFSAAHFDKTINPFYGAPQSIYSDHFQWRDQDRSALGFKLEVPPMQPAMTSTLLTGYGVEHAELMAKLPQTNVMLALMRDGFHEHSAEGRVELRSDGSPVVDYQMTDYMWQGIRRAYIAMAEVQFAAGAKQVTPMHLDAYPSQSLQSLRAQVAALPLVAHRTRLASAHVMGGCAIGEDPRQAVCNSQGRHHQLENLSIHDGSLFPTSIGANPQLSVYALSAKLSSELAEQLG